MTACPCLAGLVDFLYLMSRLPPGFDREEFDTEDWDRDPWPKTIIDRDTVVAIVRNDLLDERVTIGIGGLGFAQPLRVAILLGPIAKAETLRKANTAAMAWNKVLPVALGRKKRDELLDALLREHEEDGRTCDEIAASLLGVVPAMLAAEDLASRAVGEWFLDLFPTLGPGCVGGPKLTGDQVKKALRVRGAQKQMDPGHDHHPAAALRPMPDRNPSRKDRGENPWVEVLGVGYPPTPDGAEEALHKIVVPDFRASDEE